MPKVTQHQEAHLRKVIRDARAIDPLITLKSLQIVVEKKANHSISENYLIKLNRKVDGEIKIRLDQESVAGRVADLRERNRIICDELFRMAFPSPTVIPQPTYTDRRQALEAINRIEKNQAKLEMDFGIFERQLGTVNLDHRFKPMDQDTIKTIIDTFRAWSTPPEMRKIEVTRVIEAQVIQTTNEPTKQQPATTRRKPEPIPVVTRAGLV